MLAKCAPQRLHFEIRRLALLDNPKVDEKKALVLPAAGEIEAVDLERRVDDRGFLVQQVLR